MPEPAGQNQAAESEAGGDEFQTQIEPTRPIGGDGTRPATTQPTSLSFEPPAKSTSGNEITRFERIRFHARGGLGAVYVAKDRELSRMVALKEIRESFSADKVSQQRFTTEAIVTGSLEHPGIVPIYGLGRYRDGRPFYAMKFIKGTTFQKQIEQFHQTHPLRTTRDYYSREFKSLLNTFIDLCQAIHYAHSHNVLHRDIKPENVMIGEFGETLVVDWGLAKVIGTPNEDSPLPALSTIHSSGSTRHTMSGAVMGTPTFMSPEQAYGRTDKLDARSDIYSLGAVLFTMLTNERSVDGNSSIDVVLNVRKGIIRQIDAIAPQAPKPLISLCRKAMKTAPEDRYSSAGELVAEIERWLADDLVLAHRESETWFDRSSRFIRRNHSSVLATLFSALGLLIIVSIAALLINRARKSELAAKQEAVSRYRDSRTAIDTWLVGTNDALQYYPGTQSVRQRLLQIAADDYQRLTSSPNRDADLELERLRTIIKLGDIYQYQGQFTSAQQEYDQAMTMVAALLPSASDMSVKAEEANIHIRRGISFAAQDEFNLAATEYETAIQILEPLTANDPEFVTAARYLAVAYLNQGELEWLRSQSDRSIASLAQATAQLDSLLTRTWSNPRDLQLIQLQRARASELQGRAEQQLGHTSQALKIFADAASQLAAAIKEHPDELEWIDALASLSVSQAEAYRSLSDTVAMEQKLTGALTQFDTLCRAMPDSPQYQENRALTRADLGIAQYDAKQYSQAIATLEQAIREWQALEEGYPQLLRIRVGRATAEDALAMTLLASKKDTEQAMAHIRIAVESLQTATDLTDDQPDYVNRLAISRGHAARIQAAMNEPKNTRMLFDAAIQTQQMLVETFPDMPSYAHALAEMQLYRALSLPTEEPWSPSLKDEVAVAQTRLTQLADAGNASIANRLAILWLYGYPAELRDAAKGYSEPSKHVRRPRRHRSIN